MHLLRYSFLTVAILMLALPAASQKRIRLKQADYSRGGVKNGERVDWVVGNVIFTQNQTTIYCDSAQIFKKENSVEAFGKVRIEDGDSVTVTARRLRYDGNKRIAYLRGNVVFVKLETATLFTDFLDFYRTLNEARYFNGGRLVDSANNLQSQKGYYNTRTNLASFKTSVVGTNPDYTLTSDTLQYNSKTKVIYFQDKTTLKDKEGKTAIYENGFYDTSKKQSDLNKGTIETESYEMKGEKYFLDDIRKFYKAKNNVVMTSKEEKTTIYGDEGDYDKLKGVAKVYGHAYIAKANDDGDTLFISADTLVSIESQDPKKKRLLAYPNVKIFKSDLQGVADSLAYFSSDSTLFFYKKPVLWTNSNQMTADTIQVILHGRAIDRAYLIANSFVASQDTLHNFNQIKGRKMTALFRDQQIHHVDVEGNGETIYYILQEHEEDLDSAILKVIYLSGMNKMICSNMRINFVHGQIDEVSAYVRPDASFVPPHEIRREDTRLKGFTWRLLDRPAKKDVVKTRGPALKPPGIPRK